MTTLEEKISVMQHFANGGEIEVSYFGGKKWENSFNPFWNFEKYKYRIKAKQNNKVRMLGWADHTFCLYLRAEGHKPIGWIRVPSLDCEIEVDNDL